LVVDLDGTLILTDLLLESANKYLTEHPFQFFKPLLWLLDGKIKLKTELAQLVNLDVSTLPYNLDLIDWLKLQKNQGRRLVLATASHKVLADQVARHLNIFDEVLATEGDVNLKAAAKTDALVARFGEGGFDYVGNDWPDLQVWAKAHTAHVVGASSALLARVRSLGNLGKVWSTNVPSTWLSILKAMRMHQWLKNLLVFVPLLAAHKYTELDRDALALMAFIVFSLTASCVYLLNDLIDLQVDRQHLRKRDRPFASGTLGLLKGWAMWPTLLMFAVALSVSFMPTLFTVSLGVYFVLTIAYSLRLKSMVVVDVMTLAGLYTLRIIAGAAAIGVAVSFWLLLFSMFIFLSLALIKRYSELKIARDAAKQGSLPGRGYVPDDLEMVSSLGGSSGFIAVLVLALYIQDAQTARMYVTPQLIWLVCPALLFWIARAWLIAHRGRMNDDPIVFAIKDKVSWGVGTFLLVVLALARVLS
jgi:4-hydroxybenzoate polyprenyltransferase